MVLCVCEIGRKSEVEVKVGLGWESMWSRWRLKILLLVSLKSESLWKT